AVPADRERQWSAVTSLLAAGLADAPGLASAPSAALASLGTLDPDLDARFRGGRVGPPSLTMEVRDGFVAAVIAAAEERPLLLVVDDAQWLDAASLASLPALARDCAPHCVLLLLGVALGVPDAQRFDELQARLGRDLEGAVIRLGRLDQAALAGLVAWSEPYASASGRCRFRPSRCSARRRRWEAGETWSGWRAPPPSSAAPSLKPSTCWSGTAGSPPTRTATCSPLRSSVTSCCRRCSPPGRPAGTETVWRVCDTLQRR